MIRLSRFFVSAALVGLAASSVRAVDWQPLPAAPEARLDKDSPAEVLFRTIDVDDSQFPDARYFHEYVRYRIYDPERAVDLTRITLPLVAYNGEDMKDDVKLNARLILPNGTIRLFGKKDVRERNDLNVSRSGGFLGLFVNGGVDVKERFLAITGIEPGSVLEIQTDYTDEGPARFNTIGLQEKLAPTRDITFHYQATQQEGWNFRQFILNRESIHCEASTDARKRTITLHATNVPALIDEPFSGPAVGYEATFVISYESQRLAFDQVRGNDSDYNLDVTHFPWESYSTLCFLMDQSEDHATHSLRVLTEQVIAGAATDDDKARMIHDWVQKLYRRFSTWDNNSGVRHYERGIQTSDEVVNFENHREYHIYPGDFAILEQTMDESAGLKAQLIMLPDRGSNGSFDPGIVAWDLLPTWALRVKVGSKWRFSDSNSAGYLPFGALRWEAEGQVGLLAQVKQEFVDVPPASATASFDVLIGRFKLGADGTLDGTAERQMTGHVAETVREALVDETPTDRDRRCREPLEALLKGATITLTGVSNVDDPYKPLSVKFSVHWPGFAQVTKSRLIFHPGLFHYQQPAPLGSGARHYYIEFPYAHFDRDRAIIQLPDGYALRPVITASPMKAPAFSYFSKVTPEPARNSLIYQRDFASSVLTVSTAKAAVVRSVFDQVAAGDQIEAVAERKAAERKVDSGDAP